MLSNASRFPSATRSIHGGARPPTSCSFCPSRCCHICPPISPSSLCLSLPILWLFASCWTRPTHFPDACLSRRLHFAFWPGQNSLFNRGAVRACALGGGEKTADAPGCASGCSPIRPQLGYSDFLWRCWLPGNGRPLLQRRLRSSNSPGLPPPSFGFPPVARLSPAYGHGAFWIMERGTGSLGEDAHGFRISQVVGNSSGTLLTPGRLPSRLRLPQSYSSPGDGRVPSLLAGAVRNSIPGPSSSGPTSSIMNWRSWPCRSLWLRRT